MIIWKLIKAEYLTNENAGENWMFLGMLVFMGVLIINLSHTADEKVRQIVYLKKEVKALRSEYVELKTNVMKVKEGSKIFEKLKDKGFDFPKKPAIKLIVKEK